MWRIRLNPGIAGPWLTQRGHVALMLGTRLNRIENRWNQAWAMDITYIYTYGPWLRVPYRSGRLVQSTSSRLRVSISMEVDFCRDAVDEALARHGRPKIFNTDQGSQFISAAFTGLLADNPIRISMDGRGSWRDNVFVERLWRSVKYEELYLRAYDTVAEARKSLGDYLGFDNRNRPHSSLDGRTPDHVNFASLAVAAAA